MKNEDIAEIGIDELQRLYVTPVKKAFPYIYRAAMEVDWDPGRKRLFSPKPKEWSYSRWYQQILAAVEDEYGTRLSLSSRTKWVNVDNELKEAILKSTIGLA